MKLEKKIRKQKHELSLPLNNLTKSVLKEAVSFSCETLKEVIVAPVKFILDLKLLKIFAVVMSYIKCHAGRKLSTAD